MRPLILGLVALGLSGCSCNQDAPDGTTDATETDPGRVILHRLNRAEYNNTVRDLLGTSLTPADDFPWDDSSHGFDNNAETLTMSPLHVELYEKAAEDLAIEALLVPITEPDLSRFEGESEDLSATSGGSSGDNWNLWSNGDLYTNVEVPQDGLYGLRARVWADQAGPDLAQAVLSIDGAIIDIFDIVADSSNSPEIIEVETEVTEGTHLIAVGFINDYYEPTLGEDRNLHVDWLEFEGPLDAEALDNPIRDALLTCDPETTGERACAQIVLENFTPRAWRRPITNEELNNLMGLYDTIVADEGTFDDGLRMGLQAVLLSPNFLFRVELDPVPGNPVTAPLTGYELASRLSYFLWSSMPDEALFAAAAADELQTTEQISEQVSRMLQDPKSEALVDNLAGQWLYLRGIEDKSPDPWKFPDFDEDLRASMHEEMARFFRSFIHEDRELTELLTAQQGEIDARLADHYGVDGVTDWTEVDLEALDRGGLLGHAGLLMVNSYPSRTSPVLRGKWVLANLLCSEPPPPPAGVEGLIEDEADPQTIRDALEQHRADPVCASCHDVMDPIGLSMEHFDGVGAYRDEDNGFLVDASGELPDGTTFYGVRELSMVIATDDRLLPCIAEKTFTYALGRSPTADDAEVLDQIPAAEDGLTFEELAVHIATSLPFRYRTGETQ